MKRLGDECTIGACSAPQRLTVEAAGIRCVIVRSDATASPAAAVAVTGWVARSGDRSLSAAVDDLRRPQLFIRVAYGKAIARRWGTGEPAGKRRAVRTNRDALDLLRAD